MADIEELQNKALETWGTDSPLNLVIEDCAELIDAIQKWRRFRVNKAAVIEEGVDVELTLGQLKMILNNPVLWENIRREKIERLERLIA